MVDTHVLIYATTKTTPKMEAHHLTMVRASKALISPLSRIAVSSIVASEYVPFSADASLWGKFEIVPFDVPAAIEASRLCTQLRQMPSLCEKCLNPKSAPRACGACKHHADRRGKEQDIRIAASAECSNFATLFTFDKWLIDTVGPKLKRCSIKRPPNADGPLFEQPEERSNVLKLAT